MVRAKSRRRSAPHTSDAIALLKADHRQVAAWFAHYGRAAGAARKQALAAKICMALRIHTTLEEEIFYPAFWQATADKQLHHEAELEHQGAKRLLTDIEKSDPSDDYFDSRVKVLSEMIKHHVNEEERPGGMFARARKAKMDLQALGRQLAQRKAQLRSMGPLGTLVERLNEPLSA
jgi:hypothetical protein